VSGILVVAEYKKGNLQDITWEMLTKGAELASSSGQDLTAIILGPDVKNLAEKLAPRAKKVLVLDDVKLANYNGEAYCEALTAIINENKPLLTLIGHTAFGMDLAPRLAAHLNIPLSTACIGLQLKDGRLTAVRQMYDGKVNADVVCSSAEGYMATVRPGSFLVEGPALAGGEIIEANVPIKEPQRTKFVEYVEAALSGIDITQADILVSVGQGIGDKKNIPLVEELANILGGRLSCSRPIVDKKWLPKAHQVGSSGKTVKPKVYLAIGISGSFQHLMGIKGGTIIAINKDPKAPIFRVADYGIVGDLFQIVPILKEKAKALKTG
jgi:electron transfer flavoprotein alpha subunit